MVKKQSRRQRRRVAFDESKNQFFSDKKYPEKKRSAMYYTQDDFDLIAEENHEIVLYMSVGDVPIEEDEDDTPICTRGLEARTSKGSRKKKRQRQRAVKAVLDEQSRQQREGVLDPTIISQVYVAHTAASEKLARTFGNNDAIVAKAILSDRPPKPSSSSSRGKAGKLSLFRKKDLNESFSTLSTLEDSFSTLNMSDHSSTRVVPRSSSSSNKSSKLSKGVENFFGRALRRGSLTLGKETTA